MGRSSHSTEQPIIARESLKWRWAKIELCANPDDRISIKRGKPDKRCKARYA